jgi:hypothetical protein
MEICTIQVIDLKVIGVMYKVGMQYIAVFKKYEWYTRLRAHCCVALHRASKM